MLSVTIYDASQMYFIYILECMNNAYYTGYTTDITRRYQEHVNGSNKCKYTRSFPPRRIAACWELSLELSDILRIEKIIKSLPKKDKQALILSPEKLMTIMQEYGYSQEVSEFLFKTL